MKQVLKKYFIPHAGNNYRPHILHPKRALFYSLVFLTMKVLLVVVVVLLPAEAFLAPDVLKGEADALIALTNDQRQAHGFLPVVPNIQLGVSAQARAYDMAKNHYFSHTGPDGHTLDYFLNQAGYTYTSAGENLAMGFTDPGAIVAAWAASPEHEANILDPDFKDIGIGIETGLYRDEPTVYVAEHFGAHVSMPLATVLGLKVEQPAAEPAVDSAHSWLFWTEQNGSTLLQARVALKAPVVSASVSVGSYTFPLQPLITSSTAYVGQLSVPGSADQFFSPLTLPVLTIVAEDGQETHATLDWFSVKSPSWSFGTAYSTAKRFMAPVAAMATVTNLIYLGFMLFFGVVLSLSVFIEARRQHWPSVIQTFLVLGLLVVLWRV